MIDWSWLFVAFIFIGGLVGLLFVAIWTITQARRDDELEVWLGSLERDRQRRMREEL